AEDGIRDLHVTGVQTCALPICLGRSPTEVELATQLEISVPELEKMMLDASAVNLISLNKKWYETDSYKDVREIDILEDKRGEDRSEERRVGKERSTKGRAEE